MIKPLAIFRSKKPRRPGKKEIQKSITIIENSGLFDEAYYLAKNPDLKGANVKPVRHYLLYGGFEGRNPNPYFLSALYLSQFPRLEGKRINPLFHFVTSRNKSKKLTAFKRIDAIRQSGLFHTDFYLQNNPGLKDYSIDPIDHFYFFGAYTGCDPNPEFNTAFYLSFHKDVKKTGINPLYHYLVSGMRENRITRQAQLKIPVNISPSVKADMAVIKKSGLFDARYYASQNPGTSGAGIDPLLHYCYRGWREGKNPNRDFNTTFYMSEYPDVAQFDANPFVHWLKHGRTEGRLVNEVHVYPPSKPRANSPSVIFISHEASQTGAPAVLLSLMHWIKENTQINFSIVVGASGPWNEKFEALAPTFYLDSRCDNLEEKLRAFCGDHVKAVYVNTIASAYYAKQLRFLNAEFITHIHEMENVFKIYEKHVQVLKSLCTRYIAVSEGSVSSLAARIPDSQLDIKLLRPFIDPKRAATKPIPNPSTQKAIFGCGAVEKRKGFDLFCEVAGQLKQRGRTDVHMYWIGWDANTDLTASAEIDRVNVADIVTFLGPKKYPRDYFEWGSIFLLTSREDPHPLVCLEAAECGMPIVCFDEQAGSIHTFVEADAGKVIPYLDIEKMTDAVVAYLNDESSRQIAGQAGRQKVIEKYYVNVAAPQILEFLPQSIYDTVNAGDETDNLKLLIQRNDAVSFDIFDTLIIRKVADPNIVFDIAERKHSENESIPISFFQERMDTAGSTLASHRGKVDDISLSEIYRQMPFHKDATIENETEIDLCIAHPKGKVLFEYAKQQNKAVYLTSDMYLDKQTVVTILQNAGFHGWTELFLSSDRGKKKDTGKLYQLLIKDAAKRRISKNRILHIGDSWKGDVEYARKAEIGYARFTPLYDREYQLCPQTSSENVELSQLGRIWESYCSQSTRLWLESAPHLLPEIFIRLGYELTGPMAMMAAIHTYKLAQQHNARRIVFMARDGRIIKKAFDMLYDREIQNTQLESCYLHLSRSTVINATLQHPLSPGDIYLIIDGLHLKQKSVGYFLGKANLDTNAETVKKSVRKYFKSSDTIPTWKDLTRLSALLTELSPEIHDANASARAALETYLRNAGMFEHENIILADVGWLLNIQARVVAFLSAKHSPATIIGSYIGSRSREAKAIQRQCLMYAGGEPWHYASLFEKNITLAELLFSAPEAPARQLVKRDDKVDTVFSAIADMDASSEFVIAQKLQYGAEQFFRQFCQDQHSVLLNEVSRDYFYKSFEALVSSTNPNVRAALANLKIRLGGSHEFETTQSLLSSISNVRYIQKNASEYFDPIVFKSASQASASQSPVTIITSAGLLNGSTRYRSLNLAEPLSAANIQSTVLHSQTPLSIAERHMEQSTTIVFQRCFESQGNVGQFLTYAQANGKRCLMDMDDLVFPDSLSVIGSVKGGEWNLKEAQFVAGSYEKLLVQMHGCLVSTPAIQKYIETKYQLPCTVVRNKVSPRFVRTPEDVPQRRTSSFRMIYASGTKSHKEDFLLIENLLYEFLSQTTQATLTILGAAQVSERILALKNVTNYPLLPYEEMLKCIATHDIMLVPLEDNVFNHAKSAVKFVECAAVNVPVLASKVSEFESHIDHMKTGLLARTHDDWQKLLQWASNHPDDLRQMGISANVSAHRNVARTQDRLQDFILRI